MPTYTTQKFISWLEKASSTLDSAIKETSEMQTAFTESFVNGLEPRYDAEKARLTDEIVRLVVNDRLPPDDPVLAELKKTAAGKRETLLKRKKDAETELTAAERKIESVKSRRDEIIRGLAASNPELNRVEEELKLSTSRREGAVIALRKSIETMSAGIGFITNFATVSQLRANLDAETAKLRDEKNRLNEVRAQYLAEKNRAGEEQDGLEKEFREAIGKAAALRQTLSRLGADMDLACLIEAATEFTEVAAPERLEKVRLKEIDAKKFSAMRAEMKDYEKGLKMVAEEIGFLNGIKSGLLNLAKTARALDEQQRQYSSYLGALSIDLPAECDKFIDEIKKMSAAVVDDRRLGATPAEYLRVVEPFHRDVINEQRVKKVFGSIGDAINRATASWKA